MHRQIRRRALAAGLMTGLALLVAGSQILGASAAPIARTGITRVRTTTGLAPWLYMPSSFAGKVLHWTDRGVYFDATIADPSNGKVILGDNWMALDAQGQPTAYHVRYTYPDGQLHQEIYQNRTASVIIRGPEYLRPHEMAPPGWCVTPMHTNFSSLVGEYPLIANTAKIGQILGLRDAGMRALTLAPPSTAILPGIAPSKRLGGPAAVDMWETTQVYPNDGSKGTDQLGLAPLGRVIYQSTTVTRKDGSTAMNAWNVVGPLDVYARSAVPYTIFEVPQDLGKECAR